MARALRPVLRPRPRIERRSGLRQVFASLLRERVLVGNSATYTWPMF